ncbi:polyamine ABC transporter substrate-binding protein [Roseibium sp. RKSG952]|uniref:polyamine ABC transporter substrate-binding protein n=1 Tax=Roseibium sp. RKSG952 TaxID=2529384 RepID=UPI0012BD79AD|nr:polyamine ABC transporter substrate-binding protein [Roseibium sp. RKSG952]MTH94890.1 polyamine ABC transporter substrate-binding protein [Roseibium sp. RKSG952]
MFKQAFAVLTVLTASASPALAEDKVLNIYDWADYIPASILSDFTKETGIKIVYDDLDSNEILDTKLLTGGTGYDIVPPTSYYLSREIQAGVFEKLDKSKLPNLKNMWDVIEARLSAYDPGNDYSVNYMWGTTGIGLNPDKVRKALGPDEALNSWDLLFDPAKMKKLQSCGVYFLDAPKDVIPAALFYLGLDPDSKNPADLEKAGALLKSVRPYIRKFDSSLVINALASGDICIAMGWSTDMFVARQRAKDAGNGITVDYIIPETGAQIWFDQLAIPADAPHKDAAYAFLDFMMRPEIAAKASDAIFAANGNKASQPLLNKDIIDNPEIYPTPETMAKLYSITANDPKTDRIATRLWTSIKTGH